MLSDIKDFHVIPFLNTIGITGFIFYKALFYKKV